MPEKEFPILQFWTHKREFRGFKPPFTSVPWDLIASHKHQCLRNHSQTPERLAERGGLDPSEMLSVIHGRRYKIMFLVEAFEELGQIVEEWRATHA